MIFEWFSAEEIDVSRYIINQQPARNPKLMTRVGKGGWLKRRQWWLFVIVISSTNDRVTYSPPKETHFSAPLWRLLLHCPSSSPLSLTMLILNHGDLPLTRVTRFTFKWNESRRFNKEKKTTCPSHNLRCWFIHWFKVKVYHQRSLGGKTGYIYNIPPT